MSYDMSIGEEDFNYTYNVSKMWYAAIQILDALRYIRAMRGNARTARLCATKAERLAALRALPDSIRPLVETEYRRIFALRAEKQLHARRGRCIIAPYTDGKPRRAGR